MYTSLHTSSYIILNTDEYCYTEFDSSGNTINLTAEQLLILGRSFENEGRNEIAIRTYQQAIQIADETDKKDIKIKGYQYLGNVFFEAFQYRKAIEYYKKAREIFPGLEGEELEIEAYQWLGYNHLQAGQYLESIEYYNEMLNLASHLEDKKKKIHAYLGLGSAQCNIGDFELSRNYLLKSLTVAERFNEKRLQRNAHTNLGHVYYKSCKFHAAFKSYYKAQKISYELHDREGEGNAYLMLGNTYEQFKQCGKAIESYQKALDISNELSNNEMQAHAVQGLGAITFNIDQYEEAVKYFEMLVQLTDLPKQDLFQKTLGMCYAYLGRFEEGLTCFIRALQVILRKSEAILLNEWCGYCCRFIDGKEQEAIQFYKNAKRIAKQVGGKHKECHANQAIGIIFSDIGDDKEAKKYYHKALKIAVKLGDVHYEGLSCLSLAIDLSRNCNYEIAVTWYEKAMDIFRKLNANLLQVKAFTGLAFAWFHLGNAQKAIDSIEKARKLTEKETGVDSNKVSVINGNDDSEEQRSSSTPPDSGTKGVQVDSDNSVTIHVEEPATAEWVNSVVVESCNPSTTERLSNQDFVRMEKYIKELSATYVYTHTASSKEPLTENVRKSMSRNVKSLAYKSLLSTRENFKFDKNDGKFVNDDQQIFNFAKDDLSSKNTSTKMPARLFEPLSSYIKSIGQISCGNIRGTCFLVTEMLVITNHHVYMMIIAERMELQNLNLPIVISFDYLYPGQRENIVSVEVDEERDPQLENPHLDYKFLRLKECEGLRDRVRLGAVVRSCPLQEGRVIIVGYPEGNEMHEETCVVVKSHTWRQKLKQRHVICSGVHMTNAELLESSQRYKECLPYDTSLFSGASGSPVFDMLGNIVAMHTQGYTLDVRGGKCSLMEFGVQFNAICEDMKRRYNVVEQFFPNYNLGFDEAPMDED